MRRDQLEHAIRAATHILTADAVIIVGSQAILGSYSEDELPERATASVEVDVLPLNDDDASTLATLLDGAIGELSAFHDTHSFYVQGVDRRTATLPRNWDLRLVEVRSEATSGRAGYCLDPYDLCAAKLVANRPKDHEYVAALIAASLVDPAGIVERLAMVEPTGPEDAAGLAAASRWLAQFTG